jgi:hypothetical protein
VNEEPVQLKSITPEQERIAALFDELEAKQLEFLDEAAKRLIELATGLLGILFAVTAFGNEFPPPYLRESVFAKGLALISLLLYLGTIFMGLLTAQPREYRRYEHNLTKMQEVFMQILKNKRRALRWAGVSFGCGSMSLVILIIVIVF